MKQFASCANGYLRACSFEKDLQFSQEIWAAKVHTSSEN